VLFLNGVRRLPSTTPIFNEITVASHSPTISRSDSKVPGLILGAALGGFADGIALHQIAQWHNMGSAVLPPTTMDAMKQNMVWDGLFHVAMLVFTTIGVYLLLRDARAGVSLPDSKKFTGQLLLGWGAFNLVEGIIDHQLLGIHHVRDVPVHMPSYDWIFLAAGGLGLIFLGWVLARNRDRALT
jgi:uncharacterized membrane protein